MVSRDCSSTERLARPLITSVCTPSANVARTNSSSTMPTRARPVHGRLHPMRCRALTVFEVRLALSNLDNVPVGIADVAPPLAVLIKRLRDELGSSTSPQLVASLNIRDSEIHEAAEVIRVGDAERYRWFVWRR